MKILFITTKNPKHQGDYLELSILHGLKSILGDNLIDIPKKNILYGDFSEIKKEQLHGRGFTLLNDKFEDTLNRDDLKDIDFVIYGSGMHIGKNIILKIMIVYKYNSWILDGHDLYGKAEKMRNTKVNIIDNQQFFI